MSTAYRRCTSLRQTEVFDFALLDEVLDRSRHLFDRHIRVDTMLVEQVDHVAPKPLQGRLSNSPDPLRLAIRTLIRDAVFKAKLRCNDYLVANRGKRLTDNFFIRKRPVGFGCVEECHAAVVSCADDLDSLMLLCGWAKAKA